MLLGISFSLLICSHVFSTVMMAALLLVFIVVFCIKERNTDSIVKMLKSLFVAIFVATMLTAWYLLPMIEQMLDQEFWFSYIAYYPSASAPNLTAMFHVFADMTGRDTLKIVGIGSIIYLSLLMYIKVKKNSLINFLLLISLVLFLIASGLLVTEDLIKLFQFSWRVYVVLLPLLVLIIGYIVDNLDKRNTVFICTILIAYSFINGIIVYRNGTIYANPQFNNYSLKEDIFDTLTNNEVYNDEEISDGPFRPHEIVNHAKTETKNICFLNENGESIELINEYKRNYSLFEFTNDFDKDYTLELPIHYYKGYKAYECVNNDGQYSYVPINCYMNTRTRKY